MRGGTPHFRRVHSADHAEALRIGVAYQHQQYPKARMVGIVFSLGANVMTRYLGVAGDHSSLCAGAVLACPWNLTVNSYRLEQSALHRIIYSRAIASNIKKCGELHLQDRLLILDRSDMCLPGSKYRFWLSMRMTIRSLIKSR